MKYRMTIYGVTISRVAICRMALCGVVLMALAVAAPAQVASHAATLTTTLPAPAMAPTMLHRALLAASRRWEP